MVGQNPFGGALGPDPKLAAAVAAAVAMAMEEMESEGMLQESAWARRPARGTGAWKSSGRWQLMASRMAVQARRVTRGGR
ncbi:MAG: hypothetical protein V3V35_11570 [Dehalococcoidia bacterium]